MKSTNWRTRRLVPAVMRARLPQTAPVAGLGLAMLGFSMADHVRPYLYYDVAISICSTCYRRVEGKILFQDDKVFLLKRCPDHGPERGITADDQEEHRR